MIEKSQFLDRMLAHFAQEPAFEQYQALDELADFVSFFNAQRAYVLSGYAGTGKTSIIGALVAALKEQNKPAVLLAPTGRAAKVMGKYSGERASTIHRQIYFSRDKAGGGVSFSLRPNKFKDTVFIVDEASMLSDRPSDSLAYSNSTLLDDLMEFIFSNKGNKLILVGDEAQLPPVGYDESPALQTGKLVQKYNVEGTGIKLTKVFRQDGGSTILRNATKIRELINSDEEIKWGDLKFDTGDDFIRLQDGHDIQSAIHDSLGNSGEDETIIITRSNKRANLFNQQIRSRILLSEGELSAGDVLMVVKNNYFWLSTAGEKDNFIANGDMIELVRIVKFEELYGKRFARAEVRLQDYDDIKPFQAILLLDTIYSESAALTYDENQNFFNCVMEDYKDCARSTAFKKLRENLYFNAIQVKFGYAVTCHKSQGGQWRRVFVEQAYNPEKRLTKDYLRWLYTAITRSSEKVYLLGFEDEFFD